MVIKQAPTLNRLQPLDDQLHFLKFFGPSSALQTTTAAQPLLINNKQPILSQKQPSLINQHNQQQSRLIKLLDCVKHEFDSLNSEAQHLKSQSSKVESHVTACIADLNQVREQFIQLDREHQKLKTKYNEELHRLHLELNQRVSATGSTNSAGLMISHDPRVPPNLPSSAQMPGSNSFINTTSQSQSSNSISQLNNSNNNPQSAPILIHHENSFHQAQRDSGYSNGNNLIGDSSFNHPNKQIRSD